MPEPTDGLLSPRASHDEGGYGVAMIAISFWAENCFFLVSPRDDAHVFMSTRGDTYHGDGIYSLASVCIICMREVRVFTGLDLKFDI